jgi:hypothetical protein
VKSGSGSSDKNKRMVEATNEHSIPVKSTTPVLNERMRRLSTNEKVSLDLIFLKSDLLN